MPRLSRIVIPGLPHHVTQRGSRRGEVFFSDEGREAYVGFVAGAAERSGVKILVRCLMPTHSR